MVEEYILYRSEYFVYIHPVLPSSMDSYFKLKLVLADGPEVIYSGQHFRNSFVLIHRYIFRIDH